MHQIAYYAHGPVSTELVRLFADYLHTEYGNPDSDYVFVNLWGRPHGHPLTYAAVYDLVRRLRRKTGIDFDAHWLRHTAATRLLRDGAGIVVVARLLGHASVTTTAAVYGHLTVEHARRVMEQAGWFTGRQVSLEFAPEDEVFGGTACRVMGTQRRSAHFGLLNRFFAAIRQHRWDTALPADAMFFTEDYPKRAERLPRALAEHVMAQLEHPDNLARFDDPALQNPSENPSDLRTQANLRSGKARGTAQSAGPW